TLPCNEPRPDQEFDRLLAALRRGAVHESRHVAAKLASLGYAVEPVPGTTGLRLVPLQTAHQRAYLANAEDSRPTIRFEPSESAPMPQKWFAVLIRSLHEADPRLEAEAQAELRRMGFDVSVHR